MTDLVLADVSEFQRTIDWAAYGAACPAVIVRVHNGWRPDLLAAANIAGARARCAWRGWYQYLPAGVDPAAAAQAFAATLGPLTAGEVLILDLEEGSGGQDARAAAWHAAMQRLYGSAAEWTYTGAYFARTQLAGTHVDWVASYGTPEPSAPHELWQSTDARPFPGIAGACDASVFHGGVADLLALTSSPTTTSSTSTAAAPAVDPTKEDTLSWKIIETQDATGAPRWTTLLTEDGSVDIQTSDEQAALVRYMTERTGVPAAPGQTVYGALKMSEEATVNAVLARMRGGVSPAQIAGAVLASIKAGGLDQLVAAVHSLPADTVTALKEALIAGDPAPATTQAAPATAASAVTA